MVPQVILQDTQMLKAMKTFSFTQMPQKVGRWYNCMINASYPSLYGQNFVIRVNVYGDQIINKKQQGDT